MRETLVFMWNSLLRESSISIFQEILASAYKAFISAGGRSFEILLIFLNFLRPYALNCSSTRMSQVITNNHTSFHLWQKEKLLNHQNVSNIYAFYVFIKSFNC